MPAVTTFTPMPCINPNWDYGNPWLNVHPDYDAATSAFASSPLAPLRATVQASRKFLQWADESSPAAQRRMPEHIAFMLLSPHIDPEAAIKILSIPGREERRTQAAAQIVGVGKWFETALREAIATAAPQAISLAVRFRAHPLADFEMLIDMGLVMRRSAAEAAGLVAERLEKMAPEEDIGFLPPRGLLKALRLLPAAGFSIGAMLYGMIEESPTIGNAFIASIVAGGIATLIAGWGTLLLSPPLPYRRMCDVPPRTSAENPLESFAAHYRRQAEQLAAPIADNT